MPENLIPPRAASRILFCFCLRSPHLPQILGDLMEEFNERALSMGLSAARRWYWREVFRNIIALAGRGEMTRKTSTKTLFVISGIWFSITLPWAWLSRGWFVGFEHQEWGILTLAVFLLYCALVIGWLVPLSWALIRLVSPSDLQSKQGR